MRVATSGVFVTWIRRSGGAHTVEIDAEVRKPVLKADGKEPMGALPYRPSI